MKVSGDATLHGPVDRVYAALTDPAVLVRTIPGCERLERVGPDAYRMVVNAGVAAIKGTYLGEVKLSEQAAPDSFLLTASGSGAPGTVSAQARVRLADGADGTTLVSYDADAVVGGMIGGVGQRILRTVAVKTAGEFFAAVDQLLAAPALVVPAAAVPSVGPFAVPSAGPVVSTVDADVFTRPAGMPASPGVGDFARGVVLGAAAALLGALVGGLVSRRRRP